jgi:hypothetical protein
VSQGFGDGLLVVLVSVTSKVGQPCFYQVHGRPVAEPGKWPFAIGLSPPELENPASIKSLPFLVHPASSPNHLSSALFSRNCEMGADAVTVDVSAGYAHLLDPNRTWRNNKRYFARLSRS